MKKLLFILIAGVCITSCSPEVNITENHYYPVQANSIDVKFPPLIDIDTIVD